MGYVTISLKIPEDLRGRMQQLNFKPSDVRFLIERETRAKELESLGKRVDKLKSAFDKISETEVVKLLREDRDSR